MADQFYHGTITFQYVSDESFAEATIEDVLEACDGGPAVGHYVRTETPITRAEADRLAVEFGSDEAFFGDEEP